MKIRARFFARCREAVGKGEMEIKVAEGTTAADLLDKLGHECPEFARNSVLIAVNDEFVNPDFGLKEGDEVAFLPPVSGGLYVSNR